MKSDRFENPIIQYTKWQLSWLVLLRITIGWHFLYEGIAKLSNPDWSAIGFLLDSKGFLSGFFYGLANNSGILNVVDFLNIWGLILIGAGLILGSFTRISAIAGMVLLAFYYLSHPPFVGLTFAVPGEGSYLIVNKNLIEFFALAILVVFPTGHIIGLDRFVQGLKPVNKQYRTR
ncbi:MAG: DoxX family membrane protein [Bacteroidales bacterium]|nr:MAG: DoxX family membrane protein [Bacteroidales bacterium]